jgi:hypothetical protein
MAYDPATGSVLLFGGVAGGTDWLGDTWSWNGLDWNELSPAMAPSVRTGASMTYDSATGNVLLFGGYNSTGFLSDTWSWNGTTRSELSPTISGREAGPPPGLPQGAREPRGSEVPFFSQKDDRSPITGAVRSLIQLGRYEILLVIHCRASQNLSQDPEFWGPRRSRPLLTT